jgi:Aspartyl protease
MSRTFRRLNFPFEPKASNMHHVGMVTVTEFNVTEAVGVRKVRLKYEMTIGTMMIKRETKYAKLVCTLLILATQCCITSQLVAETGDNAQTGVSLISDAKTGTILVMAKLDGQPVTMILDTGASHSLFDARLFGLDGVQLQIARMKQRGLGLDADVVWRTANFKIGDQAWNRQTVEIADLRELRRIYGRPVDGIVGQDLLRRFSSVQINYKGQCVMLSR